MIRKPSLNGSISNEPTLSSKILHPIQPNDPIRNYLKSMQLQKAIILPINHLTKRHQQFIVDANKFNQLNNVPLHPHPNKGVRDEIDTCLDAITSVYEQSKLNISAQQVQPSEKDSSKLNKTDIKDKIIHRIDPDLIIEYINTVYHDYQIKNRFENLKAQPKSKEQGQQSGLRPQTQQTRTKPQQLLLSQVKQPNSSGSKVILRQNVLMSNNMQNEPLKQQKSYSLKRDSTVKKKHYLQLTQVSKAQRRSLTVQKNKANQVLINKTTRPTVIMSSNTNNYEHLHRKPNNSTVEQKILEQFRYCVNCELQILSANVDYHEHHECTNFRELYRMNYSQLKNLIREKIQRIKKQLRQKIYTLKNNKQKDEILLISQGKKVVDNIETYLSGIEPQQNTDQDKIKQNKNAYVQFTDSLKTTFTESIQLTNKLHWFVKVYNKISEQLGRGPQKSGSLNERLNRIEQTPRIARVVARPSASSIQNISSFPFVSPFQPMDRH